MTKVVLSLIFAIIFVVATFSKPMIPCVNDGLDFCKLEGQQNYWGTEKLSNPWLGGGIAFTIVFLIFLALLSFLQSVIFPKSKMVKIG